MFKRKLYVSIFGYLGPDYKEVIAKLSSSVRLAWGFCFIVEVKTALTTLCCFKYAFLRVQRGNDALDKTSYKEIDKHVSCALKIAPKVENLQQHICPYKQILYIHFKQS